MLLRSLIPALMLLSALSGLAQNRGRRTEIQESLESRYRITKVGPTALGMRGNEASVRRAGGVVVLRRNGLLGSFKRNELVSNAIYGDRTEILSGDQQSAVPLKAGERFYVIAVSVSSDAVTLGLLSVATRGSGSESGQVWGSLNFFFDKKVLERGQAEKIFPEIDAWLLPEGTEVAPAAASSAQPAIPANTARTSDLTIGLHPGMTRGEVVSALGRPRREITFGDRLWLDYAGITAFLEKGKLESVDSNTAPGAVKIASDPSGAEIDLNGSFVGSTPAVLQLQPGSYKITVKQPGYQDWQRELKVLAGSEESIAAKLSK